MLEAGAPRCNQATKRLDRHEALRSLGRAAQATNQKTTASRGERLRMRPVFHALAGISLPLLLAACGAEQIQPAPMSALPVAARPAPVFAFPTAAEVSAGTNVRIRPAAVLGNFGPIEPMPGANSCGVLQDSETGRVLPVASPQGTVTPVFTLAGRCTRTTAVRGGVPMVPMTSAAILENGVYMRGPRAECFLPNVGRNGQCRPLD